MSRTGWLLTTTAIATQPLTQVSITSPSNGQVLIYDSANTRWINGATTGSGITSSTQSVISQATAAFTLTVANLLARQIVLTYTGGGFIIASLTLPAATTLISGLNLTSNDLCFDFSLILAGWTGSGGTSGAFGGTGNTTVGSTIINFAGSGLFRIRRTSATTVSIYVLANKG